MPRLTEADIARNRELNTINREFKEQERRERQKEQRSRSKNKKGSLLLKAWTYLRDGN